MPHIIGRGRFARETYPKSPGAGGGAAGCQAAVVFSPDPPCTPTTTIRSDRSANQSPVTGLPVGATNLGSDTTGATTGVSGNYATVGGGDQNVASGDYSFVGGGLRAKATRATQDAWASGSDGATPGNIQTSQLVLAGTTPGAAPGETVELRIDPFGTNQPMSLEDNKAYTFRLSLIANGKIGGVRAVQSFELEVTASQDAGVVTVEAANILSQQGSAAAVSWTITATAGAAPARLVVSFSTGATTSRTAVAAQTRFTEAILV